MTRNTGFSLLEVLVALAILGISLGVLLQVFGTGLRNAVLAEEYTLASEYAESIMAAVGMEQELEVGVRNGRIDDRFAWQIEVSPYTEEEPEDTAARELLVPVELVQVQVEVFWEDNGRRRVVDLHSLRMLVDQSANRFGRF